MANSENQPIVLHQFLHGYSEGHRLLGGSLQIPDDLTRVVLRLTDLSGSEVTRGFDEYITGYPLPSLNAYALGKTWYAPEMPRPGCVWTHTIVIPESTMAQLPHLAALCALFRRPGDRAARKSYEQPLSFGFDEDLHASRATAVDAFPSLLSSHYDKAERPVLLAARESKEFEDSLFSLWSQKWPHLRMRFTFCTGSLGARFFEKKPFDIQCVPTRSIRDITLDIAERAGMKPIVADRELRDAPHWVIEAAEDASSFEGGVLRKFLWRVADDTSSRNQFSSYVSVFDSLLGSTDYTDLINIVADLFPEPQGGRRLKMVLFGGEEVIPNVPGPKVEERDALFALGTAGKSDSFDGNALRLIERADQLCRRCAEDASWLVGELFQASLNPMGEEILAGLISSMEPELARRITDRHPQFLPSLFRAKPSLASSLQLWSAAGDRQRELFEALVPHRDLDPETVAQIVRALLDSGADWLLRRALGIWGKAAIFESLEWIDRHNGALSYNCKDALRHYLHEVAEWAQSKTLSSFNSLAAITQILGPELSRVPIVDSAVWLRNFRALGSQANHGQLIYLQAFLLAMAFENCGPHPLGLVKESFASVHEAARVEQLGDDAWVILEPFVPELSWLSNWDKCERLRRGLIGAAVHYGWSVFELQKTIENGELIRMIAKSARKVDGGDNLFRALAQ